MTGKVLSDDVVSINDDHREICDVSDKDRLAHTKLTHDKGCETGIVEFVVKFRVNDKPAVNARQGVVKRTPGSYEGSEMMMISVFWWRKPEYPVPGGNHRPTVRN